LKKGTALNKLFLSCLLSLLAAALSAQSYNDTNTINIATIDQFQLIGKYELYVDSIGNATPEKILENKLFLQNNFNPIVYIPNTWTTSTIYLKFTLENTLDSAKRIYFLSGTYIKRVLIFKLLDNNTLSQLRNESHSDGYQPIQLSGGEQAVFIAKINFSKRANNILTPTFISEDYLEKFKIFRHYKGDSAIFAYIICGVLLMMMFYTGSNHLVSKKNNTFLYVFLYSGAMFFMLFLDALLKSQSGELSSFYNEYLAFALQLAAIIFYIDFTREFLETKVALPLINTILQFGKYALIALLICFTFIVYFTNKFKLQDAIENNTKIFLLLLGASYIAFAFIKKNILMNYIAVGNFILIFFSAISYLVHIDFITNGGIFVNSMVYYELGITGELIVFVAGVVYKKKQSLIFNIKKQEDQKNELENQNYEVRLALLHSQQNERNRISAEMHDDLGAGITTIRLYSELAKKRMGKNVIPEIEKISGSANELINNMNSIIWTMSTSNDSLHNMIAYLRNYALEYFEDTGINCQINVEENIPDSIVIGERRRNIFLVIKELLNNIVKHAQATEVKINLKIESGYLVLTIHDNGIGINTENIRKLGNGIKNIKKRMADMQLDFSIENNHGTIAILRDKLDS
jgi:signal transduction histidine kinase